jgi:hypothetical protein
MSPAQKELWDYVVQMAECERQAERKRIERQRQMYQTRLQCLWVLQSEQFPDEAALKQIKQLVR